MWQTDKNGMQTIIQRKQSVDRVAFIFVIFLIPEYHISTSFCWQFGCATNFDQEKLNLLNILQFGYLLVLSEM